MRAISETYQVSALVRDIDRDTTDPNYTRVEFRFSTQRELGQWGKPDQSKFIDSIIRGYSIPPVYMYKKLGSNISYVIDGVQRITTIWNFYKNNFKLSKNLEDFKYMQTVTDETGKPVEVEKTISLVGKDFKHLPAWAQDRITYFALPVVNILEATTEEINEQMYRLNNGKPLTSTQKSVIKLGLDKCGEVKSLLDNEFFSNRIAYTVSQVKRSEGLKCCISTLAILNNMNFNRLSAAGDMNKIAESFRNELTADQITYCSDLFSTLNNMLPKTVDSKLLTTTNIPMLVMNVEKYQQMHEDGDITEDVYKEFLKYWCETGFNSEEYQALCDKNVNSKSGVEARINFMDRALEAFVCGTVPELSIKDSSNDTVVDDSIVANGNETDSFGSVADNDHPINNSIDTSASNADEEDRLDLSNLDFDEDDNDSDDWEI